MPRFRLRSGALLPKSLIRLAACRSCGGTPSEVAEAVAMPLAVRRGQVKCACRDSSAMTSQTLRYPTER